MVVPRSFKLTWQVGAARRGGRWRKKYKGKIYYFEGGRGKTDKDAYDAALAAWEAEKVKIDAAAPRPHQLAYEHALGEWEQVLAWSGRHGDREMAALAFEKVNTLRSRLAAPVLRPLPRQDQFESLFDAPDVGNLPAPTLDQIAVGLEELRASLKIRPLPTRRNGSIDLSAGLPSFGISPGELDQAIWQDRLEVQQRASAPADESLGAYVDRFVKHREQRAEAGDVSIGRLYAVTLHLGHFRDWLGKDVAVKEIDGNVLIRYHTHMMDHVKSKKWERTTARHYLVTVKSFVRWLWQTEAIPTLPRIIDGKSDLLKITPAAPSVTVFTKDELTALLKDASDRTKLYILMMLNCGMTQKDIADLQADEVDWATGRIIRKRSKTSGHENVPTVNYLLWPETLRLLVQERNPIGDGLVLLNSNGAPLWTEEIGPGGKYRKTDNIKNAFERLRKELMITKPLKSLKKTSATKIRNHEKFHGLEGLFLGHAPQSMSDKHYTQAPLDLLDQAIRWLGSEYGQA